MLHRDCPGTETGSRVANRAAKGVMSAKSNLGIWTVYEQGSNIHALNGIRTSDPNNRDPADLRFRTQANRRSDIAYNNNHNKCRNLKSALTTN